MNQYTTWIYLTLWLFIIFHLDFFFDPSSFLWDKHSCFSGYGAQCWTTVAFQWFLFEKNIIVFWNITSNIASYVACLYEKTTSAETTKPISRFFWVTASSGSSDDLGWDSSRDASDGEFQRGVRQSRSKNRQSYASDSWVPWHQAFLREKRCVGPRALLFGPTAGLRIRHLIQVIFICIQLS